MVPHNINKKEPSTLIMANLSSFSSGPTGFTEYLVIPQLPMHRSRNKLEIHIVPNC